MFAKTNASVPGVGVKAHSADASKKKEEGNTTVASYTLINSPKCLCDSILAKGIDLQTGSQSAKGFCLKLQSQESHIPDASNAAPFWAILYSV